MVFSSAVFLFLFLPITLLFYYNPFFRKRGFRNATLLIFSLLFYAWGEPTFVLVMLLSIIITWLLGFAMERKRRKVFLVVGVIYYLSLFFVFKYLSFASSQIAILFGDDELMIHIALPIGISFFTFQLLSYLFDIYYGKCKAQKSLAKVALYASLFPQLIAGPIVRYKTIEKQIDDRIDNFDNVVLGMQRFIYGLGKKVLIADYLAAVADNSFDVLSQRSVLVAWLGAIAYILQIYFDFSGYSDMAIGLGRMFGFSFEENFNYPFIARSVTELWRRWHISLTSWFRDYVYIPLGGNRVSKAKWVRNIVIVWLLTGIWHGANWTFLVWGMIFCVFQLLERKIRIHNNSKIWGIPYAVFVFLLAFIFFRADSVSAAMSYLGQMIGVGSSGVCDQLFLYYAGGTWLVLILAIIGATPLVRNVMRKLREKGLVIIENIWLFVVFACSLVKIISSSYTAFIYFNF